MTQVTTAQGDMARTLEAPANQLRILQAQLTQAARAIGNIFIPALNAILPYAIAVVQVIREIANALANLAGFKLTEVDYSGVNSAAVGAGSLADNLDDAAGAAKKLKQYTAGFDELNVFAPNTGSGSGAGAGGAGGFDFDLPTYDFLGDAVQTRIGEIKKMIEDTLAEITTIVSGFMLAVGAILVVTGVNIPLGVGLMAAGAVGLAATVGLNWTAMSSELASTLALITGVVGGFLLALGAIMAFSGANLPLGIALMALGGASLVSAAVINWHNSDRHLTDALTTLTGVLAGASLAVGAMLAFTGVATGLGIALMAVGAVTLVSAAALNWNSIPDALASPLSRVGLLVSGATLALGANIILCFLLLGLREQLLGIAVFDQLTQQEESRLIRNTDRLLHVMGHNNDCIFLLQLHRQLLYLGGRNGIQRAGRFIHQQHIRLHRQRPRNAQPLLLPAGKPQGILPQAVFYLVPYGGIPQRALHDLIQLRFLADAMCLGAVGHIIVYAHRKRIRLLEYHADLPPQLAYLYLRRMDILPQVAYTTCNAHALYKVVHAVQRF